MTRRLALTMALAAGCALGALPATAAVTVQVLSSMPQWVTGGDALVKVSGASSAPTVSGAKGDFKSAGDNTWIGLVSGLKDGANTVTIKAGSDSAQLKLVNHGINDTLFAGPQQTPFLCENEALGLGKPKDANCTADAVVSYKYKSKTDGSWKDFDPKGARPDDIADTGVGGNRVPAILRIENGVINRSAYWIEFLFDPAKDTLPSPVDQTTAPGWNGKLVYAFGGGVQAAYHMGVRSGLSGNLVGASIMGDHLVLEGYAVIGGSLNRFGGNNNDVTSGETAVKVKEHFIKEYGLPMFTIGYGAVRRLDAAEPDRQQLSGSPRRHDPGAPVLGYDHVPAAAVRLRAAGQLLQGFGPRVDRRPEDGGFRHGHVRLLRA